jgi:fibulin 1/2
VYAIGIYAHDTREGELLVIVDDNIPNYRIVESFKDLATFNEFTLCPFEQGVLSLSEDMHTCDVNECDVNNGGCSDVCINEIGSFFCGCSNENERIGEDGKTCALDSCINENGECAQHCISKLDGSSCYCDDEFEVFDGKQCIDFDECSSGYNGCSFDCENLTPGFRCLCPEGFILDSDMQSCVEDSCQSQTFPFICDHTCINIPHSEYICTCADGYVLEADGHNCTEINECDINNGGCEYECINTDGGYRCGCPEGFTLRDDGRSCAISCFVCDNVESNDDCTDIQECPYGADACFATIRTRGNVTRITKGCQQNLACMNNMIQNPRAMGEGPSQCNDEGDHSKCECMLLLR